MTVLTNSESFHFSGAVQLSDAAPCDDRARSRCLELVDRLAREPAYNVYESEMTMSCHRPSHRLLF